MAILTTADIADLRALYAEALIDSCTVQPPQRPGETIAASTLPCALTLPGALIGGDQGGGGDRLVQPSDMTLWFAYDVTIPRASTITVASNGRTYEAGDVSTPGTYDAGISVAAIWKR